ncbi:uncharacterized metal-binding protein YceD (DUF177 family) [Sphingomonas jejuensis]|uniref:Uncharacterized metal-binding protein YceD (DUF177 family) n=1 Tax=Sphingomonas jejuensis TaxID=904715 RepID=A0ABX0XN43_9SPHN|nr:DUF177 domain-containing protein [Sphingomonas jejuensis]NJC34799.1 uncharacterized metal-binding protein YceD (DUF177 family) [Sphingomonas jejuensis]
MSMPEFSRRIALDTVGEGGRDVAVEADADERQALARRFDLYALDRLDATARLTLRSGIVHAEGTLHGTGAQRCVVTDAPVPVLIDEAFHLRFVDDAPEGDEIELSEEDCDTLPLDGNAIDLGEAVAETFALALPPFPRAPDADAVLRAAGVKSEEEAGPFGSLAALKDKLARGE